VKVVLIKENERLVHADDVAIVSRNKHALKDTLFNIERKQKKKKKEKRGAF
jgi:hypothetical protein